MKMENKEDIVWFMKEQIQQVKEVGSPLSKIASEELELLVEKYRTGEITLEELCNNYVKVAKDFAAIGMRQVGLL